MLNNEGRQRHPPPNSPYKGTAYRSIAFGTWAVGDAFRHFEERKRGRSSGAGEMRRRQQNDEGIAEMLMEESHSKKVQIDKSGPSLESTSKLMMSHSMGDIRHQQLSTIPMQMMNIDAKHSDLYSSNEYVQHNHQNNAIPPPATSLPQSPLALCSISSPSSSSNYRSLETLHFLNHHNPPNNHPSCSSPVPSRISCPPTRRNRFAFIIDPLKANGGMNVKQQQNGGGMRNRTKSLDNGVKFSLDGRQRQNKEKERKGEMAKDGKNVNEMGHSRLDQAKQFFRRFYASSLSSRKKRKETTTQMMGKGDGALMYSSAIGPFFEFRRPCAEELPLLPYNIHFAVDSPPQCSSADDSEDEDEGVEEGGKGQTTIDGIKHQKGEVMANGHHQHHELTGEEANNNISLPFSFSSSSSTSSSSSSARTSSSNGLSQLATNNLSSPSVIRMSKSNKLASSPDSALGGPPSSESGGHSTTANTPSAEFDRKMANGKFAEKRFANWNELFQYLRREIVEMNMRDAQILQNLETIQTELNGVKQMQHHRWMTRRN